MSRQVKEIGSQIKSIMHIEEEKRLVERVQAGDHEAFLVLWEHVTPKLFGYLINSVRDKNIAEDLLQTVWLKVVSGISKFSYTRFSIHSWIFEIARNEIAEHFRKHIETSSLEDVDMPTKNHFENEVHNELEIERIFSKLSGEDREILSLRYIADLSVTECAKVLGISYVACRVRLHRTVARAKSLVK